MNHIRHAALGLLALLLVLFVAPKVLDLFGLPYGAVIRPSAVFSRIGELSDVLFHVGSVSISDTPSVSPQGLPANFSDL